MRICGSFRYGKDPSVGGSYVGVHPHGLLWGMEPLPGQRPGIRFMKKMKRRYKEMNRGTFFRPVGTGPFPAVIDMFGTNGGCVEHRSALLASRGIASLALAYFDYEDLPSKVDQLDMNYFIEAVDWLREKQDVDSHNGIGVVGVSKGAEIAIMMTEEMYN
ncbi:acyl-coenzyme A thioesterase 5-like [Tubulanus polymorphus]|uniref:acyl-coenzyme A thioesterase 5-like n=1 Tax=Tubulanus polymorphus TaxID=672921 RepID=UPI003DA490C8